MSTPERVVGKLRNARVVERLGEFPRHISRDLFVRWYAREPDAVVMATYRWPLKVYPFTKAKRIYYYSSKWELTGYTYVHEFEAPTVYCSVEIPGARPFGLEHRLRKTVLDDAVALPGLGVALVLECEGPDGDAILDFANHRDGPPNMTAIDETTLALLTLDGPLILHGGRMKVTKHGIVW